MSAAADDVADGMLLFAATGRLPHDRATARAVVERMLADERERVLGDEWQAACRVYLQAGTDTAQDAAALILRDLQKLNFALHNLEL